MINSIDYGKVISDMRNQLGSAPTCEQVRIDNELEAMVARSYDMMASLNGLANQLAGAIPNGCGVEKTAPSPEGFFQRVRDAIASVQMNLSSMEQDIIRIRAGY
jgi:hypothetical protein